MKRALMVVAVAALAAALAAPVAAGTTRHGYACQERYAASYGGTVTFDDGALHLRGATYVYDVVGDDLCAGTITIDVNFNLDLGDWSGALWGTAVSELDAFDGGFVQSWTAHWAVDDPLGATADIWDGQYVGRGYGAMAGWQVRGTTHEATHILVLDEGFAFNPGS